MPPPTLTSRSCSNKAASELWGPEGAEGGCHALPEHPAPRCAHWHAQEVTTVARHRRCGRLAAVGGRQGPLGMCWWDFLDKQHSSSTRLPGQRDLRVGQSPREVQLAGRDGDHRVAVALLHSACRRAKHCGPSLPLHCLHTRAPPPPPRPAHQESRAQSSCTTGVRESTARRAGKAGKAHLLALAECRSFTPRASASWTQPRNALRRRLGRDALCASQAPGVSPHDLRLDLCHVAGH